MNTAFFALALLSAAAWVYLLLARGGFWLTRERLGPAPEDDARPHWPEVLALIPARDEAGTIARTVAGVLGQNYPGRLRLIVVDDQSGDGTAELAREAAARQLAGTGVGERFEVLRGEGVPEGWTGKLWALEQGRRHARQQGLAPDYLWLTDADIAHDGDTLRRLVDKAERDDRDLVSLMVRLAAEGVWGRLLIPPFVFFFRKLYPFAWANDPKAATAAAAGGCVLLRRAAFDRAGGFAAIAGRIIDDCALAERIKRDGRPGGGRIWVGLADRSWSLRPYRGLGDIWAMVARSAYAQLQYSPWLLAGTVAGMVLVYLVPPLAALGWPWHGSTAAGGLGLLTWGAMAAAMGPTLALFGRSALWGVLLPLAAALYCTMTLDSARTHALGRGGLWKGRTQAAAGRQVP